MTQKVYPNGNVEVTIPATESIAVYTEGVATVYRSIGYPNLPDSNSLLGEVNNEETVFGAYASGATIIINAGASEVYYEVGVAPRAQVIIGRQLPVTATALNATGAVTAAMILGGIVTSTTAAAVAGTVPTGTVMDAASEFVIGVPVFWSVIATGANAFTVTAAADHTLVGTAVVATVTSGRFATVKTAANTFVTYRVA